MPAFPCHTVGPLAAFTPMTKRRSIVRAGMALPAVDSSPWKRQKPLTRGAIKARTGVLERTQSDDARRLGIGRKRNWQPNDGDDFERYPLYQMGNSHSYGLSGPVGRIRCVQIAVLGASCLNGGLGLWGFPSRLSLLPVPYTTPRADPPAGSSIGGNKSLGEAQTLSRQRGTPRGLSRSRRQNFRWRQSGTDAPTLYGHHPFS